MRPGVSLRVGLGWLVLALWFASALSLAFQQWREAGTPRAFGPEIPEENREAALAVLDGCRDRVGPGDTLAVAFSMSEGRHQFLAFRLAYMLYPTRVAGEAYDDGDDLEQAVAKLAIRRPRFLLILGREDVTPPLATLEARLAPEARLFRFVPRPR
jgi:hypothetical protein